MNDNCLMMDYSSCNTWRGGGCLALRVHKSFVRKLDEFMYDGS